MAENSKIPPQSVEAESSLIGSILIDQEAMTKIADIVSSNDFYETRHNQIFSSILQLYEQRRPIDVLTVTEKLESSGIIDKVGGASYITDLANSVPSAAHVEEYADIVAKKATLRRLIGAAQEITNLGYSDSQDTAELIDQAEQLLYGVSDNKNRQAFRSIGDVLSESFDRIEELSKDKGKLRGVSTGFRSVDNILAGLQNSDLLILAARPAMGKSSFALNIAHHVAIDEGIPVGLFSLEMSQEQLVDRLLSAEAGVDSWKLRTGNLDDKDFAKIGDAMGVLSEAPIFIDDTPMANVMDMRTKARRIQSQHGLGLIIVDYLQLMSGRGNYGENRVQEVSEISRGLKGLARELNVPVLALSQLSRGVESRNPQIPQLADLRESGSIEQDADVVMFLYREEYYNPDTDRQGLSDLFVKKHRNGPTGQVELYFHAEKTQFREIEKQRQ
ncbi:MAG: replicative DNA helicase [Candidatus Saccharimonadales bacterium]